MAESYRYKVYINLGFGLVLFVMLLISMFSGRIEIYEETILAFSGMIVGLLIINGLEWLRLEQDRLK